LSNRFDVQHAAIRDALRRLRRHQVGWLTTHQNMAEFWNACTRPATARGGLGFSIAVTGPRPRVGERIVPVRHAAGTDYLHWKQLVKTHSVRGTKVYDARLVAFMQASSIADIFSLNVSDFTRYPGIKAHDPAAICALFP